MKGQTQVVSTIIVVLLILTSVATLLPWGSKVIQKKKDIKSLDDTYNFFLKLDNTIRDVAKNGGEQTLSLDIPGILEVHPENSPEIFNNSIMFTFVSRASNIASGDWIPLNSPNTEEPGILGIDSPSVIFGRAEMSDNINIYYRLWYRELQDKNTDHKFQIQLKTSNDEVISTSGGFVKIQRRGSSTVGDLTVTEINIII
jgi:hypothetical protein